jgi:hypothetical protein
MDCPWETDNDTDEDTNIHEFNGVKKGFLLKKPPDRREPEKPTESIRA